jgi:hypothetical protein
LDSDDHQLARRTTLRMDMFGPPEMGFFHPDRIFRWNESRYEGTGAGNPLGTERGPGGHVQAIMAGTYRVRVSNTGIGAGCSYTLVVAEAPHSGTALPGW